MANTKNVADFMRADLSDMERVAADVHARAVAAKARHMELMDKTTAKLDEQDIAMGELESLLETFV